MLMKKKKPYLIELKKDCTMKNRSYTSDNAMEDKDHCSIIVIICNEYTLLLNDGIQKR